MRPPGQAAESLAAEMDEHWPQAKAEAGAELDPETPWPLPNGEKGPACASGHIPLNRNPASVRRVGPRVVLAWCARSGGHRLSTRQRAEAGGGADGAGHGTRVTR